MNLHIQKSGKSNKGFYIALGVCLIAVGVAAWTTYDSVVNYATPRDETQSEVKKTNNNVSGIFVTESSGAKSSSQVSSAAVSSAVKPAESKPSSTVPAKKTSANAQTFSYPVEKTILQKFSRTPVYCKTTQDYRAHTGIDLSAKQGDTVKAAADGTVKKVYKDDRLGNTVIITHGDVEIRYCGLAETSVKAGDSVTQGQKIGTVGSIPIESDEGSHLHLEVLKNSQYIDPLSVLQ